MRGSGDDKESGKFVGFYARRKIFLTHDLNSKRNVCRSGKTCSSAIAYGVRGCAEMLIRIFVVLLSM